MSFAVGLARFHYRVEAVIEITGKELCALRRLALSHYDHACKALAIPGRGAWLHGALNTLAPAGLGSVEAQVEWLETEGADSTVELTLTSGELDTACKVLEMTHYAPEADMMVLTDLFMGCREPSEPSGMSTTG